jgi:hypothetical protein
VRLAATPPTSTLTPNAFNKRIRTLAAQVEVLKRYPSGGEQKDESGRPGAEPRAVSLGDLDFFDPPPGPKAPRRLGIGLRGRSRPAAPPG